MNNWTYFASYQSSTSDTRALPSSFSELYIADSSHIQFGSGTLVNFLIPRVVIPNVNSVDQSLGLVDADGVDSTAFAVLRIWSGGMVLYYVRNDGVVLSNYYDVYYR